MKPTIVADGLYWRARYADPSDGAIRSLQFPRGELSRDGAAVEAARLISAKHRPLRKSALRIEGLKDKIGERSDIRDASISALQHALSVLIEAAGNVAIARIDRSHLGAVESLLGSRGLAPTTVSNTIRRIGDAWEWAKSRGLVKSNPFRGIKSVSAAAEWAYVSEIDAANLASFAPTPNYRALVLLARFAGLRKREAMELHAENVRWDTTPPELTILPSELAGRRADSTKRGRTVPIIERRLEVALQDVGEWNGPLIQESIETMYGKLRKMHKMANLGDYGKILHTLRKSCEDDWLRRGDLRPVDVCQWLGNSIAVAQKHYMLAAAQKALNQPSHSAV